MSEYENRKSKDIKSDKQLVAGVGASMDPYQMGPSSTTDGGFSGIDVDGVQQDHGKDSLTMRPSLVDSYMASSTIESRNSDANPKSMAIDPVKA